MTSRNPRAGPSGLTRTQQLRQTRSAALMKEREQKEESARQPVDVDKRRRYPVHEPKRVEFAKPTMTKAVMARVKHAERFKQEYERKREETIPLRRVPRRTPAPIAGDPRIGRERMTSRRAPTSASASTTARKVAPGRRPGESRMRIPERTKELARSMNAQVIQAEPVGEGPIDSIVIPPRVVSENRTTIVSIPQSAVVSGADAAGSQVANRSIRVISESLDEQDAAEVATVQGRLEDLQQARRDFVFAVANVGGNAVQIGDEDRPRYIYNVPDIEDEMFRVRYGRDHPSVVAAREFAQRSMAGLREREAARRFRRDGEDRHFGAPPLQDDELLYETETPWEEEDEEETSRTFGSSRDQPYEYSNFDPEQLQRFFDVEHYPPSPPPRGRVPPGRENLHPDLWELDDPWAVCAPCSDQDVSDFMKFEST